LKDIKNTVLNSIIQRQHNNTTTAHSANNHKLFAKNRNEITNPYDFSNKKLKIRGFTPASKNLSPIGLNNRED
jgi:hypothetical protein